jgi:hypothetical protein
MKVGNPYRAIPSGNLGEMMDEGASLSLDGASEAISGPGVHLLLGYHPRANLNLAVDLCLRAVRRGGKALAIDCDRTIALETERSRVGPDEVARILLSHPGDIPSLKSDVKAAASLQGMGILLLNRASSLVGSTELLEKYGEKRSIWASLHPDLRSISLQAPVLVLEDARRYDQIEYKIHPALYYLSDSILDAVEEGKTVTGYRMVKKRLIRSP